MNYTDEELAELLKRNDNIRIDMLPKSDRVKPVPRIRHRKGNKYHVSEKDDRTYNGILYQSKKEAEKAADLDLEVKAGNIDFWLRQVAFPLPGGTVYRMDFMSFKCKSVVADESIYALMDLWALVFIEVKGFRTRLGEIKRKQCEEIYGIKIEVV